MAVAIWVPDESLTCYIKVLASTSGRLDTGPPCLRGLPHKRVPEEGYAKLMISVEGVWARSEACEFVEAAYVLAHR